MVVYDRRSASAAGSGDVTDFECARLIATWSCKESAESRSARGPKRALLGELVRARVHANPEDGVVFWWIAQRRFPYARRISRNNA